MTVAVRLLGDGDQALLSRAVDELFDNSVDASLADAFLRDPHHHIAAAVDADRMVGFVSAVEYWHPDKPREFFINEVSVAPSHRRCGVGLRMMQAVLALAWTRGCRNAWVTTDSGNAAANRLYAKAGGLPAGSDIVMYTFYP